MKIKNERYRNFLDNGLINTLNIEDLNRVIENITGKYALEGKVMLALLYYTGARPVEILNLYSKDIKKEGSFLIVHISGGKKRALPRSFYLSLNKPHAATIYKYACGLMPELLLFSHYRNSYVRTINTKKGLTTNESITDKLRYYFKLWFAVLDTPVTPYFLRHNRFSRLSEKGLTPSEIMQLKGARSIESVRPYLHMSTHTAKKISKKVD